jgi:hypothetical protein
MAFSQAELIEMFKEFHQYFMPDFQITLEATTTLFEYLCDNNMLGVKTVKEVVLTQMGIYEETNLIMIGADEDA